MWTACLHNSSGLRASQHCAHSSGRLFGDCPLVAKDGFAHNCWLFSESMSKWETWRQCTQMEGARKHKRACVYVSLLSVTHFLLNFCLSRFLWTLSPPLLSSPCCLWICLLNKPSFAWAWGLHFLPGLISMATEKKSGKARLIAGRVQRLWTSKTNRVWSFKGM